MGAAVAHAFNLASGDFPTFEYVAGRCVVYRVADGRRVHGQVVGPDQEYFPSPRAVFVSFPSGFTHLIDTEYLELEG